MIEETMRKLNEMKLFAMVDKLRELTHNNQLDSTEQLAFMVDAEYDRRQNNRIKRLLGNAKIKLNMACVEDIDYSPSRNLKKDGLTDLLLCNFIKHHNNVLISGATGTGKTYVACALSNLACRHGYTALYYRASTFLEFMGTEKATGNYLKTLEKCAKVNLLVLDDLGPDIMNKQQRNIFLDIVEERYLLNSTIITSQLPLDQWYGVFDEPTTADAVCDRLFHNAHKILLKGDSMRKNDTVGKCNKKAMEMT
jgi:DNA replication protein DnaC